MKTILLSDIGGTNIRFACWKNGFLTPIEYFKRADFESLEYAIDTYLSLSKEKPDSMIFGVAGPVENNAVYLTNGNWFINGSDLQKKYQSNFVQIVNDFVLQGYGIVGIDPSHLYQIGRGYIKKENPCAVLGPGTGLGVCFLVYDSEKGYTVLSSEGGHTSACVLTENQQKIIDFLPDQKAHFSFERLVSGPGLCALYQAVCSISQFEKQDLAWKNEFYQMKESFHPGELKETRIEGVLDNLRAEHITESASLGNLEALLAFWYFFQFLGIFAGNMALSLKTSGGVFLVGDLLADRFIKSLLVSSQFRKYFESKGRFSPYLSHIPTFLVLKKDIPFAGLTYLASHL